MFFQTIYPMLAAGADLSINIKRVNDRLSVAVMPRHNGVKDEAQQHLVPLILNGTAVELDAEFLQAITMPVSRTMGILANLETFERQAAKVSSESRPTKTAQEKEPKEAREKREKMEKLLKKTDEAVAGRKYSEALIWLKQAKVLAPADRQKEIDDRTLEVRKMADAGNLFAVQPQPGPAAQPQPTPQPAWSASSPAPVNGQQPASAPQPQDGQMQMFPPQQPVQPTPSAPAAPQQPLPPARGAAPEGMPYGWQPTQPGYGQPAQYTATTARIYTADAVRTTLLSTARYRWTATGTDTTRHGARVPYPTAGHTGNIQFRQGRRERQGDSSQRPLCGIHRLPGRIPGEGRGADGTRMLLT